MKAILYGFRSQINPFSVVVLIGLDLIWSVPEIASAASIVGIVDLPVLCCLIFIICGLTVAIIQHNLNLDTWKAAILKGVAFGIIAGLPFSVFGIIGGFSWKVVELIFGQDELRRVGAITLNWRKIERTVKSAAENLHYRQWLEEQINAGINHKDNLETIFYFLGKYGGLTSEQINYLNNLRRTRNTLVHVETQEHLGNIVQESEKAVDFVRQAFTNQILKY